MTTAEGAALGEVLAPEAVEASAAGHCPLKLLPEQCVKKKDV